jgi:hypothetical protein
VKLLVGLTDREVGGERSCSFLERRSMSTPLLIRSIVNVEVVLIFLSYQGQCREVKANKEDNRSTE